MPDDWDKWQNLVLGELKRIDTNTRHNTETLQQINVKISLLESRNWDKIEDDLKRAQDDISVLKIKAGLWGTFGGAVSMLILIAIQYIGIKPL